MWTAIAVALIGAFATILAAIITRPPRHQVTVPAQTCGDSLPQYSPNPGKLYADGMKLKDTSPYDAAQLLIAAAELGHPEAKYKLAFLYIDGNGVRRNVEKGYELLRLAAKQGEQRAVSHLATLEFVYTFVPEMEEGKAVAEKPDRGM